MQNNPKTHEITKDQHVWNFSSDMKPVIEVLPGDQVNIETWDCFTGQVQSEADTVATLDLSRINSATGPIGVLGSEPGDLVSVSFNEIVPNEQGAAMVIPEWGQLIEHCKSPITRIFKVKDGIVHMNEKVSFPSIPMFGVIGVAPAAGSIQTFDAGAHGGNMDDHLHAKGTTVYLPVFQSGAQIAIGDMHASMGDGEISGTGVEIGGRANLTVGLKKKIKIGFPVAENSDSWFTHGSTADNIDDALKIACEEAARLLVDQWGFTMEDAFIFLSVKGDLGIAAYYHPSPGCVTARMRVPKIAACPAPFRS
jgi:amidase